ncbi:MAG: hypothetical protein JSS07_12685 [Proteobacteria bacterium]|nr:hypothetical protein [Pseudomonadota bacterium]
MQFSVSQLKEQYKKMGENLEAGQAKLVADLKVGQDRLVADLMSINASVPKLLEALARIEGRLRNVSVLLGACNV